jgi:cell division protease FtsH
MATSGPLAPAYTDNVEREPGRSLIGGVNDSALSLASEWRKLGRIATFVALLTAPALYVLLHDSAGWPIFWSVVGAFAGVVIFRGFIDVVAHRLVPFPSLYGAEDKLRAEDVVSRRRHWYWKTKLRRGFWLLLFLSILLWFASRAEQNATGDSSLSGAFHRLGVWAAAAAPLIGYYGLLLVVFFFINLVILFGPLFFFSIQQIKGYEPGDADWGVKLEDVRGQAEAKEEIRRVVSLWQSGEEFERAGGKRERGVLFLGPPGTGKTMLSKAIATEFNCPFVAIPGSGFAQMFMGMDALIVRYMARKAKKLAAKWGGQCIVFIDEIDAVGMRRQALGSGFTPIETKTIHDVLFFGEWGAVTPDGERLVETRAWRDRLFASRAEPRPPVYPPAIGAAIGKIRDYVFPGGMNGMSGGQALNQLLVVMDGIDEPPLRKKVLVRRFNTFLDAMYVIPQKIFGKRIRMRSPKPRSEQIYFIGACNVPIQSLDPALVRPGRLGRHIYFRTPTWEDRRDVFDLYIKKVAHEPSLDTPKARDELARITSGYSPAMIDQVCSLALTYAHADGRPVFSRRDVLEAMTTVEAGVAIGQPYPKHEERATAIHEAGHAVCGHIYMENRMSTRLSIRKRGASGGHHQVAEIEDRFGHWRSEEVGDLIWGLGAIAAEHVFYNQNTTGVAGDLNGVTIGAAHMVSVTGMAPAPVDLSDRIADRDEREKEEKRAMERFEKLGFQLMHRSGSEMEGRTYTASMADGNKRRLVAGLIGQCFVVAWNTIKENREATDRIAERLIAVQELYGDDVNELLNEQRLRKPTIDVLDEATWPVI